MARIILLAVIVFAFAGCKPADQNSASVGSDVTNTLTNASTRDRLMAQMQVKISQLESELTVLSAKVKSGGETVKAEAEPKLQALRDKIAGLNEQVKKIGTTSASKWDDVKAGFEKSSDDVKSSLTQARQWLSDKIAPAASSH